MKMMTITMILFMNMKIDYDKLKLDYISTMEDDDYMAKIKEAVFSLSEPEQRVFLLYTELGSYAAVARQCNCSSPTVRKYVTSIINKIKDKIC